MLLPNGMEVNSKKDVKVIVEAMLRQGISVDRIHTDTDTPKSTIRLWKSKLPQIATPPIDEGVFESLPERQVDPVLTEAEIYNVFLDSLDSKERPREVKTRIERILKKVALIGKPIQFPPFRTQDTQRDQTTHVIIKHFAAAELSDSTAHRLINLLQALESDWNVVVHFVGDHFGTGSFKKSSFTEEEQAESVWQAYSSIYNAFKTIREIKPDLSLDWIVHGSDIGAYLLQRMISQNITPSVADSSELLVLSGLKSQKDYDDHQRKLSENAQKILYVDTTTLMVGPKEYCFGDSLHFGLSAVIMRFGRNEFSPSFAQIVYF